MQIDRQLADQIVHVILINIKQNKTARPEPGNLAAKLGADGTAGSRNKDRPSADISAYVLYIDIFFFPAEQIVDVDVPKIPIQAFLFDHQII